MHIFFWYMYFLIMQLLYLFIHKSLLFNLFFITKKIKNQLGQELNCQQPPYVIGVELLTRR